MTPASEDPGPARTAATLVREARKAALATLEGGRGFPFASLVVMATDGGGAPLMLLSRLAVHTQNLAGDERASVLVDASGGDGDPLSGGRVTLGGRAVRIGDGDELKVARRRYLARHPSAQMYVDFADFSFWRLEVERAHLVGGFGRIATVSGGDLIGARRLAAPFAEIEPEVVEALRAGHSDDLGRVAMHLRGDEGAGFEVVGADPWGLDLMAPGRCFRLWFRGPCETLAAVLDEVRVLAEIGR